MKNEAHHNCNCQEQREAHLQDGHYTVHSKDKWAVILQGQCFIFSWFVLCQKRTICRGLSPRQSSPLGIKTQEMGLKRSRERERETNKSERGRTKEMGVSERKRQRVSV